MSVSVVTVRKHPVSRYWPAAVVWLLAWLAMAVLDGHVYLANQALILVLAAALAALWLPVGGSVLACTVAVMGFNYAFVPGALAAREESDLPRAGPRRVLNSGLSTASMWW